MYAYSLSLHLDTQKKREFTKKFASYLYQAAEPEEFVYGKRERKRKKNMINRNEFHYQLTLAKMMMDEH